MAYKLEKEAPSQPSLSTESLHRLPVQAVKGAAATLPGIFGDILSLPYAGVNAAVSALGGSNVPYEESALGKIIPTTQSHIKTLEEGIPYLKPKNKIESFISDVASDATSLAMPAGTLAKAGLRGTNLTRSFLTSLGANTAGATVADLTGDPQKGAYTKMGAMFLFSALNKPGAQKEVGKLYQEADKLLPEHAIVNSSRLESEMNGLKNKILHGRGVQDLAPSEKFVIDQADTILRQVHQGQSNVGTLKSALRSLNENLQKAIFEAPDKASKVRAKKLAKQINRNVNETLADYGKTNPEWWKAQKAANEGFATLQQSNFITNFIEKNVKHGTIAHGLMHALGIGVGAAGYLPYEATKLAYRISKSPTLAKHYARVVSSAAAENASVMNKELSKLDEELKKEESIKKTKYKLID